MTKKIHGLNTKEVNARIFQQLQNNNNDNVLKSTFEIIGDNVFTLFNFLNFLIACFLTVFGAYTNLYFMLIILANILIGVFCEFHARKKIANLSHCSNNLIPAIRNGKEEQIKLKDIVVDDVLCLNPGQLVPVDTFILSGECRINEALLSGIPSLVPKNKHQTLLAGSRVVTGSCIAKVLHVGKENYSNKIANEAKFHKPIQSELFNAVHTLSKITSIVILPLGVALFFESHLYREITLRPTAITVSASLLGMLPKGLALLLSFALVTSIIRLSKQKVLTQDRYAIELLAHVDTLCFDKTGTLTEGNLRITKVLNLSNHPFELIFGDFLIASKDESDIMNVLRSRFPSSNAYKTSHPIPFTLDKQWGSVYFENLGTVVCGIPEMLMPSQFLPVEIQQAQENGLHVLMVALSEHFNDNGKLPKDLTPIALLVLDDPLRENVKETIATLHDEGLSIKIISGDHPLIASNIAKKAGVIGYGNYFDLSQAKSIAEIYRAATKYTVFGGVTPQQKKLLIQELQAQGRTVAMVGDGINDVLALREADCSIAMAEADSSAKQIAHFTLLNSDLSVLPNLIFEGRRVVNNISKVTSLFFIKTFYSFVLANFYLLTSISFSFVPFQIILIEIFIEGIPSMALSFEEAKEQIHQKFLPYTLKNSIPFMILFFFMLIYIYSYGQSSHFTKDQYSTLIYYSIIGISLLALFKACLPLNPFRLIVFLFSVFSIFAMAIIYRDALQISLLDSRTFYAYVYLFFIALTAVAVIFHLKEKSSAKIKS